ncbi:hypothetical protein BDU57DRAFT_547665 [Ampelomyces quisqualis]|uniref:Uncharacterized protein n=1 Tax=Ampelomyces quisqualis TaxID=50730 RepID=A0A6A5QLQ8_AMPQU|nr:hypothetical protein BDU57DRAFT_547665 [Ampelomyces quisqualis]
MEIRMLRPEVVNGPATCPYVPSDLVTLNKSLVSSRCSGRDPDFDARSSIVSTKQHDTAATSLPVLSVSPKYRVGTKTALEISLKASITNGVTQPAPIYLRGIHAQALVHISYRIPASFASKEAFRKDSTEKLDLFNHRSAKLGLQVTENTCLKDCTINATAPPTFKTCGVVVRYDVR